MSISLCMIAKNNADCIGSAIDSVTRIVDEIIVVDTGSQDNTKEVAKAHGARVFDFKWCDDFSKARNEALKHATKEWVLQMDCDETITDKDLDEIKQAVQNTEHVAFILYHRNYTNDSTAAGWVSATNDPYPESDCASGYFTTPRVRLFRQVPDIYYENIIHESVDKSVKKVGTIGTLHAIVHHYGYLQASNKKNEQYLKLSEQKAQDSTDFFSLYELGRQQLNNNNVDDAIATLQQSIEHNSEYDQSWYLLGTAFLVKGDLDQALSKLKRAQALNPKNPSVYANLGTVYAKQKLWSKAIKQFEQGLKLSPTNPLLYKHLGFCYDALGETQKAHVFLKKAVQLNPAYAKSIKLQ